MTGVIRELWERESEIDALADALKRSRDGRGGLVVVEGPAGIGKTSLLAGLRERAGEGEVDVLAARGGELEHDFSFGVARQLFEPRLRKADVNERAALMDGAAELAEPVFSGILPANADGDGDGERPELMHSTLHGLYWLAVNLAAGRPALICVDDAHWADRPSLRFLTYLAPRLEEIPLLVAVAMRPAEPGVEEDLLDILAGDPGARVLRPEPLSDRAARGVLADQLDTEPDPAFADACCSATRGNPFLLRALGETLSADGIQPTGDQAERVVELGSRPVARGVWRRLRRLGAPAEALAGAIAVLGEGATLLEAAELAGTARAEAREIASALEAAQILELSGGERVGFRHAVIRDAIYREMAAADRSAAHARAARLLAEMATEPDRVAQHLLRSDPIGDRWTVRTLRTAADRAIARGAPDSAAVFLERALAEPPPEAERPALLLTRGIAQARADLSGEESMERALEISADPLERARIALALGRTIGLRGEHDRAVEVLERAHAELAGADRGLELRLNAEMIAHCLHAAGRLELGFRVLSSLPSGLTGEDPAERMLLTVRAFAATSASQVDAETGAGLVRPMTIDDQLTREENSSLLLFTAETLVFADALEDAASLLDRALAEFRVRGSRPSVALASAFRSQVNLRRGRVLEAEADGWAALELAPAESLGYSRPYAISFMLDALVERGELDEADRLAEELGSWSDWPELWQFGLLTASLGALRVAQGRAREGLDLILESGRRLAPWRPRNPSTVPWRSSAALVHHALGEDEEARRLAQWELEHARASGGRRGLGVALHAAGVVTGGEAGIELLGESIAAHEASGARLEHARALVSLGTALHRLGRRAQARKPLRQGLDIALRCGGEALASRARRELAAAGALPRRELITGPESLTARELQVAQLAATGASNREVAQALFVTVKTVDAHLGRIYRKLDIRSRRELAGALAPAGEFGAGPSGRDLGRSPARV